MGLTLHLGVLEVPYSADGSITTGDVADILEAKYGVMQTFYDANEQAIADTLAEGFQGTLESMISGRPVDPQDLFLSGTGKIEDMFHDFILSGQVEGMGIEGVPTEAAIERRSQRFKKGKGPARRPSFVDSGLYESAFKAWVDPI